ncbi:uncharacterized protein BT62DRAFT_1078807 [Guyanagaster necrorhizus]|uniref:Uncharacterized protein n=1 Tax=Guyanagaster necrorhizus TaxID=856835 RepID=A0A9P7VM67_9AGAR|nr:uncharacterized protein BT62DRAFT_1078807 [Guyanagaster necrorhizus MCA 3950]KAG7443078.1 hypothetical protein BT62DRAFT_1078807 [Guyanagaster necrorhizus MCA 3950]
MSRGLVSPRVWNWYGRGQEINHHRIVLPLAFQFRSNQTIFIAHRPPHTRHLSVHGMFVASSYLQACGWWDHQSRLHSAVAFGRISEFSFVDFARRFAGLGHVCSSITIYGRLQTETSPQILWPLGSYNLSPAKATMGATFSCERYPDPDEINSTVTAAIQILTYDGTLPRSGTFPSPTSDGIFGIDLEAVIIPCISYSDGAENVLDTLLAIAPYTQVRPEELKLFLILPYDKLGSNARRIWIGRFLAFSIYVGIRII